MKKRYESSSFFCLVFFIFLSYIFLSGLLALPIGAENFFHKTPAGGVPDRKQ
jgi:hypothetical protein